MLECKGTIAWNPRQSRVSDDAHQRQSAKCFNVLLAESTNCSVSQRVTKMAVVGHLDDSPSRRLARYSSISALNPRAVT